MVRELYDATTISAQINPVFTRVRLVVSVEWMFLGGGRYLLKN